MISFNYKKIAAFAGGVLFGTAGLEILKSRDARKVYTHTVAAVIRAKDAVMKGVTCARENASDILAEAREINAKRAEADEAAVVEDASENKD